MKNPRLRQVTTKRSPKISEHTCERRAGRVVAIVSNVACQRLFEKLHDSTMRTKFAALLAVIFIFSTISSASLAYSRGPYLPQDSALAINGTLLMRSGLNERCEEMREDCDPYSEFVLSKTKTKTFEFGIVRYKCVEIDDGAYGALSCTQTGYDTVGKYATCSLSPFTTRPKFQFRDWSCN